MMVTTCAWNWLKTTPMISIFCLLLRCWMSEYRTLNIVMMQSYHITTKVYSSPDPKSALYPIPIKKCSSSSGPSPNFCIVIRSKWILLLHRFVTILTAVSNRFTQDYKQRKQDKEVKDSVEQEKKSFAIWTGCTADLKPRATKRVGQEKKFWPFVLLFYYCCTINSDKNLCGKPFSLRVEKFPHVR